jgi:hypothetical protein
MASQQQLNQKLEAVIGKKLIAPGQEPPRLVRANSAFAKPTEKK